ncbi:CynX/NimT family MFS transporter [Agrobacterium tumefaciens]|uniref:MFS transporter n=1 Tax=Agrobacterium tumefaciens TaxID=358 RepID=UPI001574AF70|nr:MFS transporter [Agrobacterium tumefaciens]NTA19014.1 MFS transporter [Agrobacterium tumefaciens]WCK74424.1 MFS transporter [Agrobacterium tumefaciens]
MKRAVSMRPLARSSLWAGRTTALVAIAISALNLRSAVTSLSPLLHRIGNDLGFGSSTIAIFGMLPPACFAVFGTLTPALVRRMGLEQAAVLGLAVTAFGIVMRSLAGGDNAFMVFTVIALAGMGIAGVVIPPLVRKYFSDRLSLTSTVYLIAMHLGALIPPLVAVPLAEAVGWRAAIAGWAGIALAGAGLWAVTLKMNVRATSAQKSAPDVSGVLSRHAWRSPTVWNLTVLFGMTSWNVFILFTWLPTLLTNAGHSEQFGGSMVSLLISVSMIAGIFLPTLTIKARNPFPIVGACVVLFAIGYGGLGLAPATMTVIWVILLGAASSLFIVASTMINTHSRTPAGSAVTSAFVQGFGGALAILGPLLFGLLHGWTGDWAASYGLVAISLVVMSICGYRERCHLTIEDEMRVMT